MRYNDKQLHSFQTYLKGIAEKTKDRVSYANSEMVKKMSKLDESNEAKQFYYDCQNAPIEELLKQRNITVVPAIKKLEAILETKRLELQMLDVFIRVHHPESVSIAFIQKCILVWTNHFSYLLF